MAWQQWGRRGAYTRPRRWGDAYKTCPCGGWAWADRGENRCRDCGALFEDPHWPTPAEGRGQKGWGSRNSSSKAPATNGPPKPPVGPGGASEVKISGQDATWLKAVAKLIKDTKGWDIPISHLLGEEDQEKTDTDRYKALVAARHQANQAEAKFEKAKREADKLAEQLKLAQAKVAELEQEDKEASENGQRGILTAQLIPSLRWSSCEKNVQD